MRVAFDPEWHSRNVLRISGEEVGIFEPASLATAEQQERYRALVVDAVNHFDELVDCIERYVAAYEVSRETMDPLPELKAVEAARGLLKRVRG